MDVEIKYTILTPLVPVQGIKEEKKIRKFLQKNRSKLPDTSYYFADGDIVFEELVTVW